MTFKKNDGTIIFGASGLIGSYLYDLMQKQERNVIGTYNKNKKKGLTKFNILKSSIIDLPLKDVKYGIICSAIVNIDNCKKDVKYSYRVNVEGVKKIINDLVKKKITPIFVSSSAVFSGKGGNEEYDCQNPVNVYGKQKLEVENFIIKNLEDYLIIRTGKVFGINLGEGLFVDWFLKYKEGKEIPCIYDEKLSVVFAKDLAKGINILLEKNKRGIYHINPKEYYAGVA